MGLNITLLVTMGSVTVGGFVVEKVLGKLGKIEEAGYVGFVTSSMLITTVITCAVTAFAQVGRLGK